MTTQLRLPIPEEGPVVGDLVAAFHGLPNSPLASAFVGDITLHLPDGVARSALTEDYFFSADSTDYS
ncbi:hypothetical protein MT418_005875 [Batrachochytrium dendrobatidis]